MAATPLFDREQLIATLAELARQRLAPQQAQLAQTFFGAYFHRVPADDLARSDPEDLYAGALAHLDLARQRQPGQPLLCAYNPTAVQHGRASRHTVVEAVVDDMAFLVDSVSMALNRLSYTIHLTIHPVLRVGRGQEWSSWRPSIIALLMPSPNPFCVFTSAANPGAKDSMPLSWNSPGS